jgi:hypothetical protein
MVPSKQKIIIKIPLTKRSYQVTLEPEAAIKKYGSEGKMAMEITTENPILFQKLMKVV